VATKLDDKDKEASNAILYAGQYLKIVSMPVPLNLLEGLVYTVIVSVIYLLVPRLFWTTLPDWFIYILALEVILLFIVGVIQAFRGFQKMIIDT
jgi:hypothetical protein